MSNPTQSIKDQLAELFNEALLAQQGVTAEYTAAELTFGAPTLYDASVVDLSAPTARNTVVTASVEVEIEGADEPTVIESNLHYNRLLVSTLISNYGGAVEGTGDEASTYDLLPALSLLLGTELLEEDFEDVILEEIDAENYTITLRAVPGSLGYFGEGTLTLTVPPAIEAEGDDD